MIDTLRLFEELKEFMDPSAAKKIAESLSQIYEEVKNTVTREDFKELKAVVAEITESVKGLTVGLESFKKTTEENFTRVWSAIDRLTEAQQRVELRVEELAEAQKRTELRVEELAEAQKRTEEGLESFKKMTEENFTKVWSAIMELREAQKETSLQIRELFRGLADTREMVAGLSDTVGYGLEDRAMKSLPDILKKRYGITVTQRLVRRFIKYNGRHDEVNIYGVGKKGRKVLTIIGEAKSKLSKRHIEELFKLVERLRSAGAIHREVFPLVVTYSAEPAVEEAAREKGVALVWSYEL